MDKRKLSLLLIILGLCAALAVFRSCTSNKKEPSGASVISELSGITQLASSGRALLAIGVDHSPEEKPRIIASQDDGKNWTVRSIPSEVKGARSIIYANGNFVVPVQTISSNTYKVIQSSNEGKSWSLSSNLQSLPFGLAFGNSIFVGVGTALHSERRPYFTSSSDAVDWTDRTDTSSMSRSFLVSVVYDNSIFVTVGASLFPVSDPPNGDVYTGNAAGTVWTRQALPANTPTLSGVISLGNAFLAVGLGGTILKSDINGGNWISKISETSTSLYGLVFGNGKVIAVGGSEDKDGIILVSEDEGETWRIASTDPAHAFSSVIYANNKFFIAGVQKDPKRAVIFSKTF